MKKLWHYVSHLGTDKLKFDLHTRTIILNNQLNFIIALILSGHMLVVSYVSIATDSRMTILSYRVLIVALLCLLNLYLAKLKLSKLSRLSAVFLIPLLLLLVPTFFGYVEEESFAYYPFVIIAFSILPQILVVPDEERQLFFGSILYYALMLVFIESILHYFETEQFEIERIHSGFFTYYKSVQIGIFLFLHIAVYYLRRLNIRFEHELNAKNAILDKQNDELREMLERLQNTQQQLIQSEKLLALGTLTSGVAHEINNPLNFIAGGLDVLQDSIADGDISDPRERQKAITIMNEGVERITSVIEALMAFTVSDNDEKEETEIVPVIEETINFLNWGQPENLSIERNYKFEGVVSVYSSKLHHILLAILENAFAEVIRRPKSEKEIIRISTDLIQEKYASFMQIRIFNTGNPIPDTQLAQIFDPFYTTKDPGSGSGLGLTTALIYVKDHGGSIEVENSEDGVSFIIRIPFA